MTRGGEATDEAITPELIDQREITNWQTDIGVIDVMWAIGPDIDTPQPYADLIERAVNLPDPSTGKIITVASLDDIEAAKRNAGRAKDHIALRLIEQRRRAEGDG